MSKPLPSSGLMSKLEADWQRRHGLYYDSKAPPIPSRTGRESSHVFKPKKCMICGICVCSNPGKAAHLFWEKLAKVLRRIFKPKSEARAQSEIVLRFDSELERHYLHIGYCNLKTWHFSVLDMMERQAPFWYQNRLLQPLCLSTPPDEQDKLISLALHRFCDFDLDQLWTCRVCLIVQRPVKFLDIQAMEPQNVDIAVDESVSDFVWQGYDQEKPLRLRQDCPSKRKKPDSELVERDPATRKHSKDSGNLNSKSSEGNAPAPAQPMDVELEDHQSKAEFSNPNSPAPSMAYTPGTPVESDATDRDDYYESDEVDEDREEGSVGASSGTEEEDGNGNPLRKMAGQALGHRESFANSDGEETGNLAPVPPEEPQECDPLGSPSPKPMGDALGEEEARPDSSGSSSSSNSSSSTSSSDTSDSEAGAQGEEVVAPPAGVEGGLPEPAPRGPQAAPAGPRVTDDRFDLEPWGSIRYNFRSGNLVAHCAQHAGNCRRTRTVNVGLRNAAQGRPIGLLAAFLQQADDFPDARRHSAICRPTLQQRQEARRHFESLAGGRNFADLHEREKRDNEEREPENAP